MLRPTKHAHPDQTVISVSVVLLKKLKTKRLEDYDGLREYVKKTVKGGDLLYLPALNLLYLLGIIEYRAKTDSLEYVGPNEAI